MKRQSVRRTYLANAMKSKDATPAPSVYTVTATEVSHLQATFGTMRSEQGLSTSLRCRAAIRFRCKGLEPQLVRDHTLGLRRRLIKAAEERQQQVADRGMRDLAAAEDKQLATTGSQKKSKTKKKTAAKQKAQESHDGCSTPDETAAETSGYVELAQKVTLGQA
ncbi:hypothetical protein ABBQ38_001972 [Trebouxia sp. C0009 RCD-2024]